MGIREDSDGVLVDIEVSVGSSKFEIGDYNPWRERLEVKVKSPPSKGKANKELIKEFSNIFEKEVKIIHGIKSPYKTLRIKKINKSDFIKKLKLEKVIKRGSA
ncbi:DUF167 family protein [Methanothermobacter tenebrarum]|uniref:UPF0235 protein DPC56_07235 n=1 Tax=Methanothermobacter tenebrarum TaxID=680118 RepID=A0A328PBW9_9EURY|nr:DUF167 family protein [Methanothermobacter tenebrarum]NPV64802.1 YggU family protein [Methanobacteriaceae archaeon]RAO78643.1 YggU family protein [Methanothermobacter tenebrarum]